jgi:hypothetical protein
MLPISPGPWCARDARICRPPRVVADVATGTQKACQHVSVNSPGLSPNDLAAFEAAWSSRWPDCRPVGHELRVAAAETWVRFHSIPKSKRYPVSKTEYDEVLRRHRVVLGDLASQIGEPRSLRVVTAAWSPSAAHANRESKLRRAFPAAEPWRTILLDPPDPDDDDPVWIHLFVGKTTLDSPELDALLRLIADDETADVILSDPTATWLYHPYDGGGDVIAPDKVIRDALRSKYEDWLPGNPLGL